MRTTETESSSTAQNGGGQLTAENRRAEVDGETFLYRRFGNAETDAPPLLCTTGRYSGTRCRV